MSRTAPDVLDGLRSPEMPERKDNATLPDRAKARARSKLPAVAGEKKVEGKPGVHRFMSHISRLRITRKITPSKTSNDGTLIEGEHFYAQFENGYYETSDQVMAEFLLGYRTFGVDYFDADQLSRDAQETADREWLEQVAARPDLQEKLKTVLGATDFKLEDDPKGSGGPTA